MMETVFIMPFVALSFALIIYFGWNFRRMAQVTNMDRYSVWQWVTPGSPGPNVQGIPAEMRNPRLNNAFYGLTDDQALRLDEYQSNRVYRPIGHELLRDQVTDEAYSYFDAFIENNPKGLTQRFEATHEKFTEAFDDFNWSDLTRNAEGHSRMHGDWRYVNGIRYDSAADKWKPAHARVSPGESLREVFFAEMDDGLEPYDVSGNNLAKAIREFYLTYPQYVGPDVQNDRSRSTTSQLQNAPF